MRPDKSVVPKGRRRARDIIRQRIPERWKTRLHVLLGSSLPLRRLIRRVLENRRDLEVIEGELKALSVGPWHEFQIGRSTVGTSERVVEVPWVVSRYKGERRVLDVGTTFGLPLYLRHLRKLAIPELHAVDIAPMRIKGMTMTVADVRKMPYPDSHFELIHCISTLEHVGRERVTFGTEAPLDEAGDVSALCEMRRVLVEGGRILITVPFGRLEQHAWFKQYDLPAWEQLIEQTGLQTAEVAFYGYSPSGWHRIADRSELASRRYGELGAPAATALLCAALSRP